MFILNKHVPLKKEVLEANQAPYMTESLRKDKGSCYKQNTFKI